MPPSQSPFSHQDGQHELGVELGEGPGLGLDVPLRPARIPRSDGLGRRLHRLVALLGRLRRERPRGDRASRPAGRAGRASEAVMPAAGRCAVTIPPHECPTIASSGRSRPAARMNAGELRGGVGEPVGPAAPTRRPAVPGHVDRDDPTPGRGERRRRPATRSPRSRSRRGRAAPAGRLGRPRPSSSSGGPRCRPSRARLAGDRRARPRRRAGRSAAVAASRSCRHGRTRRRTAIPPLRRATISMTALRAGSRRRSMANQFVVQLKNQPGAMAILAEELAARGVDLRAIGGGGLGDSGHVIMTTADDDDDEAGPRRGRLHVRRGRVDHRRGRRQARRHGPHRARPRRRRREHPRPPVPRPLGRSGDVRVRRRPPGPRQAHPRAQGLAASGVHRARGTSRRPAPNLVRRCNAPGTAHCRRRPIRCCRARCGCVQSRSTSRFAPAPGERAAAPCIRHSSEPPRSWALRVRTTLEGGLVHVARRVPIPRRRHGDAPGHRLANCHARARARRQRPTELYFSEYIEGSSNNKALEIYNGTGATVDLAEPAPTTSRCSSTAARPPA